MRITSGTTDQVIYFVAVDPTDLKTRKTGLSSFAVYLSRNGGAAAPMTTPTVTEVDGTNMPGVYKLLLDEDMDMDGGNDTEEMVFHITQASMAPVTRTIELDQTSDILYQGNVDSYIHPTINVTVGGWSTNQWAGRPVIVKDSSTGGTGIMSLSRCVSNVSGELTIDDALTSGPTWGSVDAIYIMRNDAAAKDMMLEHYISRILTTMEVIPSVYPYTYRFLTAALINAPQGDGYDPWTRAITENYPAIGETITAGDMMWMLFSGLLQREVDGDDLYVIDRAGDPAMRFSITRNALGHATQLLRIE